MSDPSPTDQREIGFSRPMFALLSDDSVRIFSPETFAIGAALCVSTGAILFWMGLFSAL